MRLTRSLIDVPDTPDPAEGTSAEWASALIACLSLALLFLGLIGLLTHLPGLAGAGFLLFALLGFGTAPLLLGRRRPWLQLLALGPTLGISIIFLVGTALVVGHLWSAGLMIFAAAAFGTAVIDIAAIYFLFANRKLARALNAPIHYSVDAKFGRRAPVKYYFVAFGVLICATSMALVAALAIRGLVPGMTGIFGIISPFWYLGLALVVTLIGMAIRRNDIPLLASSVVAIMAILTLTPVLVYAVPRYSWTYKHIGVTAYFLVHGMVGQPHDIYQAWPGLFAGIAWLMHVSGLSHPIDVARWWTPAIDLATLLCFRYLAGRVLYDPLRSWIATALFVLGSVIGQDYFSPQSAAYLLSLGLFSLAYRRRHEPQGMRRDEWLIAAAYSCALAVCHQLSPFLATGALIVLVLFGMAKSRWIPIVTIIPALLWDSLHLTIVNSYFHLNQVGNVASNIETTGSAGSHGTPLAIINVSSIGQIGAAAIISSIALSAIVVRRHRFNLALGMCAVSAAVLVLVQSYGNEALNRVFLFGLPWLCILAAGRKWVHSRASVRSWVSVISILMICYIVAMFTLDYINVVRSNDLSAELTFERSAPNGSSMILIGQNYVPIRSSSRYPLFSFHSLIPIQSREISQDRTAAGKTYTALMTDLSPVLKHSVLVQGGIYVLISDQSIAAQVVKGEATHHEFSLLVERFAESPNWQMVVHANSTYLFMLKIPARPTDIRSVNLHP